MSNQVSRLSLRKNPLSPMHAVCLPWKELRTLRPTWGASETREWLSHTRALTQCPALARSKAGVPRHVVDGCSRPVASMERIHLILSPSPRLPHLTTMSSDFLLCTQSRNPNVEAPAYLKILVDLSKKKKKGSKNLMGVQQMKHPNWKAVSHSIELSTVLFLQKLLSQAPPLSPSSAAEHIPPLGPPLKTSQNLRSPRHASDIGRLCWVLSHRSGTILFTGRGGQGRRKGGREATFLPPPPPKSP